MKLIFFLIAFCLLSLRVYFSWSGKERENHGVSIANLVIRSDHYIEEIKYSGKFELTEDESGFKSISPGGYLKYRKNDTSVLIESNLQGVIDYHIEEGRYKLSLTDARGKSRVAEAVREMLAWGFDAGQRIERLYRRGGSEALIREMDSLKTDQVKVLYLNRLFAIDSLTPEECTAIAKKISSLGSNGDKTQFLKKFSTSRMMDLQTARVWFTVLESLGNDQDKTVALDQILTNDSLNVLYAGKILEIAAHLGADWDRARLYQEIIARGLATDSRYDSLVELVSQMGSGQEKINLYLSLLNQKNITEGQWNLVIYKTTLMGSDMDKSNLLIQIARKMPKTEKVKASYLKAAQSIQNDSDYGRALRAVN